jgi:hypothetical protein
MRMRILLVLALVAASLFVPAVAAHAQCGPIPALEESLSSADVAFVGKVVDRSNRDRTAVMQVMEVWKGARQPAFVTVSGGPEDLAQQTAIDRTFLLGQIYLVIPANSRDPFQDSLCTATQLWTTPTGTIPVEFQAAVGAETAIAVLAPEDGDSAGGSLSGSYGSVIVAMIVIVGALGLIYGFRRLSMLGRPQPGNRRTKRDRNEAPQTVVSVRPKRRRGVRKITTSGWFDAKGPGSRLEKLRKGYGKFRKSNGEHEKELVQRAAKLTATRPPSRRNHYASERRRHDAAEAAHSAALEGTE